MAEWQQFIQSVFFGVIFSFLLAKLFAVIFAFREENLRVVRGDPTEESQSKPSAAAIEREISESDSRVFEENKPLIADTEKDIAAAVAKESGSVTTPGGDDTYTSGSDSDSDWEGVESTELDEAFSAATAFVAATAADRSSQKVSNDVQLQLYGLYKIATEGPCSTPQPSPLKMTARAKWQAWQKLGAMPPEEAMQKYIEIVTELYPSWITNTATKKEGKESSGASSAGSRGPMGPVFSTFTYEDEPGNDLKLDAIHAFAREGDAGNLLQCIENGFPVNAKDSEGRAPLHWAVDRGHLNVTELLLSKGADINAKDNDGQTALHYAAVCERATLAEFLVKHKADIEIKDNDGNSPADLCELNWPWMQQSANVTD
ncbi:acyl-CoA-binding domain-containing protein 1-like [Coffea eugenioides]|uniref:Acyl-CoA-binding domain-containing protein 1-like n=1 Tax=Coffea arabica TaxID=13443 RepID=A0A6P6W4Y3_COFAR|nr:acyl-CoA-binding domain-containing protein 1-like [Coffea arabica]XP_027160400.1 acyl-CoA-binding domain-containing protein 1-like [Coffea eugenioides]